MTRPFVVLEGLSGTGKSAVAVELAKMLNATLVRTPGDPYALVREKIDHVDRPIARYLFYLSSVCAAGHDIQEARKRGGVVCDRFIDSSEAAREASGVPPLVDIPALGLPAYDLCALLVCDEDERKRRLTSRGMTIHDRREAEDFTFAHALARAFDRRIAFSVDTTHRTPARTAELIVQALGTFEARRIDAQVVAREGAGGVPVLQPDSGRGSVAGKRMPSLHTSIGD